MSYADLPWHSLHFQYNGKCGDNVVKICSGLSDTTKSKQFRMKRRILGKAMLAIPVTSAYVSATYASDTRRGDSTWDRYETPEQGGFSSTQLATMEARLYEWPTTSLMIVRKGKIVYTYGDVSEVSYVASARKSLLSMLYGKYVKSGAIDLDKTIGEIGIAENQPLLDIEKSATVRNLLTSSSGIYWPGGSPGGDERTPPRGSKTPGTFFQYNNWDFNVAGEIFQRMTGKTVFDAFQEDIAVPLGFEDWDRTRQRMLGYATEPSRYKAYHFFLSARDMARLGLLMVNQGECNGRQIIPKEWVRESTKTYFRDADPREKIGYGYLWWTPSVGRTSPEWKNSFLANGHFGQFILGLPSIDTVIVHRRSIPDQLAVARNLGVTKANIPAVPVGNFLTVADMIVNARTQF